MKTLLLSIICCLALTGQINAQYCGTVGTCTTIDTFTQAGLYPSSYCLSPVVIGTAGTTVFQFKNFDTISFAGTVLHILSVKIDSINNLPPGLCWTSNSSTNTFTTSETGCIQMNGTPKANSAGQYQLRIIIDVTTQEIGTLSGLNAAAAGLYYYVRAITAGDNCPHNVDTTGQSAGTIAPIIHYIAGQCPSGGVPCNSVTPVEPQGSLSANGPLCGPSTGQLTFTASAGNGPFTVVYGTGGGASTATGVVSGTPFNVAGEPVSATTTFTLVSVTGSDGGERTSGFTGGTATITVNALPKVAITASGPTTFCDGGNVVLTAKSGTGYKYTWSTGATTKAITVTTTGSYSYTVSGADGCHAVSAAKKVTVDALPTAKITVTKNTVCAHGTAILTATKATGDTYKWSTGITTRADTITATGTYHVTITNTHGCSAAASEDISCSAALDVSDKTEGNQDDIVTVGCNPGTMISKGMDVMIYPNPYSRDFRLNVLSVSDSNYNVAIYDLTGRLMEEQANVPIGSTLTLGSGYSASVYIVQVRQGDLRRAVKVVKAE